MAAFHNAAGEEYLPAQLIEWDGVNYSLAGKTRDMPVSQAYLEQLMSAVQATDPNLQVKIVSGGQSPKGSGGKRTGSTRHDVGPDGYSNTADLILVRDGKEVRPGDDKALYSRFLQNAAAVGFPGIGHYSWGVHIGGGKQAAWGPSTSAKDLDPDFKTAIEAGWKTRQTGVKLPYKDIPKPAPLTPSPELMAFRAGGGSTSDDPQRDLLAFLDQRAKSPKADPVAQPKKDLLTLLNDSGPAMAGLGTPVAKLLTPELPDNLNPSPDQRKRLATGALPMDQTGVQARATLMDDGVGALLNSRSFSPATPNPGQQPTAAPIPMPQAGDPQVRPGLVAPKPLTRPAQFAQPPQQTQQDQEPAPEPSATQAPQQQRRTATLPSGKTVEVGRIYNVGGRDFIGGVKDGVGTMTPAPQSIVNEASGNSMVGGAVRDKVREEIGKGIKSAVAAAPQVAEDAMTGLSSLAGNIGNMFGGMFGGGAPTSAPVAPTSSPRTRTGGMSPTERDEAKAAAPAAVKAPVQGLIKLRPVAPAVLDLMGDEPMAAADLAAKRAGTGSGAIVKGPQAQGARRGTVVTQAPAQTAPVPLSRPAKFTTPQEAARSVIAPPIPARRPDTAQQQAAPQRQTGGGNSTSPGTTYVSAATGKVLTPTTVSSYNHDTNSFEKKTVYR